MALIRPTALIPTRNRPYRVSSIVTWLGSLTGEMPQAYIAKRELPGAGKVK